MKCQALQEEVELFATDLESCSSPLLVDSLMDPSDVLRDRAGINSRPGPIPPADLRNP